MKSSEQLDVNLLDEWADREITTTVTSVGSQYKHTAQLPHSNYTTQHSK